MNPRAPTVPKAFVRNFRRNSSYQGDAASLTSDNSGTPRYGTAWEGRGREERYTGARCTREVHGRVKVTLVGVGVDACGAVHANLHARQPITQPTIHSSKAVHQQWFLRLRLRLLIVRLLIMGVVFDA